MQMPRNTSPRFEVSLMGPLMVAVHKHKMTHTFFLKSFFKIVMLCTYLQQCVLLGYHILWFAIHFSFWLTKNNCAQILTLVNMVAVNITRSEIWRQKQKRNQGSETEGRNIEGSEERHILSNEISQVIDLKSLNCYYFFHLTKF